MAAAEQESGQRRATTELREWIRSRADPLDRGSTARLTEAAVAWMQQDADLLDRFVYEQVYNTTAEIVRAVFLESRRVLRLQEIMARSDDEEEQTTRLQQWLDRMEHFNHTYVRLGSMTKEEVALAAEEQRAVARRGATKWRWFATLAAGMDEGQTVEERYTAAQVEALYQSAAEEVDARLESILAGVDATLARIMNPPPPRRRGRRREEGEGATNGNGAGAAPGK